MSTMNLLRRKAVILRSLMFFVGCGCLGSSFAQRSLTNASDQGASANPSFLISQVRPLDSNSPGVFSGISLSVSDKLSIESYFRATSSLSSGALGAPQRVQGYSIAGQTLMGQYRFGDDQNNFRPRLGAGLAYNLSGADRALGIAGALHGDSSYLDRVQNGRSVQGLGLALELGASYTLSKSWYLEGSVMKSYIRSSGSALNAGGGSSLPGLKIDPLMFSFSVGFKFE